MLVMTKLRMEKGWACKHLAHYAGLDVTTVQRHEKDKRVHLTPNTAKLIATALGVGVFDIAEADGNRLVHREIL